MAPPLCLVMAGQGRPPPQGCAACLSCSRLSQQRSCCDAADQGTAGYEERISLDQPMASPVAAPAMAPL